MVQKIRAKRLAAGEATLDEQQDALEAAKYAQLEPMPVRIQGEILRETAPPKRIWIPAPIAERAQD